VQLWFLIFYVHALQINTLQVENESMYDKVRYHDSILFYGLTCWKQSTLFYLTCIFPSSACRRKVWWWRCQIHAHGERGLFYDKMLTKSLLLILLDWIIPSYFLVFNLTTGCMLVWFVWIRFFKKNDLFGYHVKIFMFCIYHIYFRTSGFWYWWCSRNRANFD